MTTSLNPRPKVSAICPAVLGWVESIFLDYLKISKFSEVETHSISLAKGNMHFKTRSHCVWHPPSPKFSLWGRGLPGEAEGKAWGSLAEWGSSPGYRLLGPQVGSVRGAERHQGTLPPLAPIGSPSPKGSARRQKPGTMKQPAAAGGRRWGRGQQVDSEAMRLSLHALITPVMGQGPLPAEGGGWPALGPLGRDQGS